MANDLLADSGFQAMNAKVDAYMQKQLDDGAQKVTLTKESITRLTLDSSVELLLGFRGTQGLEVTGSGSLQDGKYVGTLTYEVEDSYGFPTEDHLLGVGDAMRYLQVACGAPQTPGGAQWFPDSITVNVKFSLDADTKQ